MIFFVKTVEDWDTFEKLLDYLYTKDIKSESCLHPVLMSEASVSTILMNSFHAYDVSYNELQKINMLETLYLVWPL